MAEWMTYENARPEVAGVYRWRVPHATIDDLSVVFDAHMRMRGNGRRPGILSPNFDHWDGYTVTVPAGTEWQPSPDGAECPQYGHANLRIDGLDFMRCPFCGKSPVLKGVRQIAGGGISLCAEPHQYNVWWLQCCQWGNTPHLKCPREIETIRRKVFAKESTHA